MEKGAVWLLIISQLCIWGYVWWKKRRTRKLIQGEPERHGGAQKQSREMKELAEMRKRSLNTPLSEKARPAKMNEVIGQEEGIRALRAAMCGPNPQHVIIYGPPGCGKTCAARLVLEEAPDVQTLELSLLSEVKRNDKGTVEIKLVDRLRALEQLLDAVSDEGDLADAFFAAAGDVETA